MSDTCTHVSAHLIGSDLFLQPARGVRKEQIEMRDRRRAERVAQAGELGATLLRVCERVSVCVSVCACE